MPRILATLALLAAAALPTQSAAAEPTLPILVYHQIRDGAEGPPDALDVISLARFEAQMRHLAQQGYVTLGADEVVDFLARGVAPAGKIVAIQFDDGWKSSLLALPVLDRLGFKATFWVIPGKGIGWPHMDWEEVLALDASPRYDVGSHTMTHPWKDGETLLDWMAGRTPGKGRSDAAWELAESRRLLEEKLGRPVRHLAWPRGLYSEALVQLAVEAGYEALFTVDGGINRPGDSLRTIRRVMIQGTCDLVAFEQSLVDGKSRACRAGGPNPAAETPPAPPRP